jgi:hypothetical protein
MITGDEAVNVLIAQCRGTYSINKHWTTQREFKLAYDTVKPIWHKSTELHDKVFTTYMPHEWINN